MKQWMLSTMLLISGAMNVNHAMACTDILVGRKASLDGSVFLAYSADGYGWFAPLHYVPAATHKSGDVREIIEWDSYMYLGDKCYHAHKRNFVSMVLFLFLKTVNPFGEEFILLAAPMLVGQDNGCPEECLFDGIFKEG
jgi:hypothetical protein